VRPRIGGTLRVHDLDFYDWGGAAFIACLAGRGGELIGLVSY
jgi:hypothetical protein